MRAYIVALPEAEQARWELVVHEFLRAAEQGAASGAFIARVAFPRVLWGPHR
jgi:hypothetical protein